MLAYISGEIGEKQTYEILSWFEVCMSINLSEVHDIHCKRFHTHSENSSKKWACIGMECKLKQYLWLALCWENKTSY